jgi:hypothetical protein
MVAWTTNSCEEIFPGDRKSSCNGVFFEFSGHDIIRDSVCPETVYVCLPFPVIDKKLLLAVIV